MSESQNPLHDRNVLDLIRSICKNGESGRLEILAGAIQGELSFKHGKLVDARVGHLTGFQAINALAGMQSARVSFDPSFETLAVNAIRPSERLVLKQFFGIETADAYLESPASSWQEAAVPTVDPEPVSEPVDEVTIVRSDEIVSSIPSDLPRSRRVPYLITFAFAALVIAIIGGAAVLINRLRERTPAVVASVESPSRSVTAPVQQPEQRVVQDLSGKWNIVNTVETTSYGSFKNMQIGFDLSIDQTGSSFTGRGRKVSENGRTLPANGRTPIHLTGTINGDRIEATFFEDGAMRKTNGRFVWRIDRAGRSLKGTFATTAARSSGKSAATREL